MWTKNNKGDMILNLGRAHVIGVVPKDLDKGEWAVLGFYQAPSPPVVMFEGTRDECQERLEKYAANISAGNLYEP